MKKQHTRVYSVNCEIVYARTIRVRSVVLYFVYWTAANAVEQAEQAGCSSKAGWLRGPARAAAAAVELAARVLGMR